MVRVRPRVPLALLVITLVGGCVVRRAVSIQAVEFNRAVESAKNDALLLNLLRARNHEPMHFTRLEILRGNVSVKSDQNLTLDFPPVKLGSNYSYSSNPSFDIRPQDDQEFMRGLTESIDPAVAVHFWDRGFDRKLLIALLVRSVHLKNDKLISNIPEAPKEFLSELKERGVCFQELTVQLAEDPTPLANGVSLDNVGQLQSLASALERGLKISKGKGEGGLSIERVKSILRVKGELKPETRASDGSTPSFELKTSPVKQETRNGETRNGETRNGETRNGKNGDIEHGAITLRSPIEILHHAAHVPGLIEEGGPSDVLAAVRHRGAEYHIPRGEKNGCILIILHQILSLHEKGETGPGTSAVTIVGGGG